MPVIVQEPPALVEATAGAAAQIAVISFSFPGAGAETFYWRRDGVTIMAGQPHISGETTGQITLSPVGLADAGEYDVVISNGCGWVTSTPATLRVLCPGDFDGSGERGAQDLFDFLAAYFGSDPRADFNGVGGITVQDIFDFLAGYFAPCV
jgi:hypothetical protein